MQLQKKGVILIGISIRDIAKLANVSVSTVSRVLNNSKPVSEDLRIKVMEVVEQTGFTPNSLARGLVNKRTGLIGVMIPRISNTFFSSFIEGLEEVALSYGYNILLTSSNNVIDKEIDYLNIFKERQLDGIIFSVTEFTERHEEFFRRHEIPTVFVGQKIEQTPYPYVTIDNLRAGYEATRSLINQNHRKIAILRGPESDFATGQERFNGYKKALNEAGIQLNSQYIAEGYHTIENGYFGAAKIMSSYDMPTAIFATSDLQALGAINYLQDNGYRVPEDISVIGFDDIELASLIKPKLTTIHQSPIDIGTSAMRLLMEQIQEKRTEKKGLYIPYRLVSRESTKNLGGDGSGSNGRFAK